MIRKSVTRSHSHCGGRGTRDGGANPCQSHSGFHCHQQGGTQSQPVLGSRLEAGDNSALWLRAGVCGNTAVCQCGTAWRGAQRWRGEDCHSTRQARSPSQLQTRKPRPEEGKQPPQDHPPPKSMSQRQTRAVDSSLSPSHQKPVQGGTTGRAGGPSGVRDDKPPRLTWRRPSRLTGMFQWGDAGRGWTTEGAVRGELQREGGTGAGTLLCHSLAE